MNLTPSSIVMDVDPAIVVPLDLFYVMLAMSIGGLILALILKNNAVVPSIISLIGSTLMFGSVPFVARVELITAPILTDPDLVNYTIIQTITPALSVWWWYLTPLLLIMGILSLLHASIGILGAGSIWRSQ